MIAIEPDKEGCESNAAATCNKRDSRLPLAFRSSSINRVEVHLAVHGSTTNTTKLSVGRVRVDLGKTKSA